MGIGLNFETVGVNIKPISRGEAKGVKNNAAEIATPIHITDNMVSLFDYTDYKKKIWMDIYCKSGNTIESLMKHGIKQNNIAAICPNRQCQMLVSRKLYGYLPDEVEVEFNVESLRSYRVTRRRQIYFIECVEGYANAVMNNADTIKCIINNVIRKAMENTMSPEIDELRGRDMKPGKKFEINNIVMNPPYNNDLYIDFVELAHGIATDAVVAITPAKWQAKGGAKNEEFRKNIVPRMKDIVYYPCCKDVFDVAEVGGITYFNVTKNTQKKQSVDIISINERSFHKTEHFIKEENRESYYGIELNRIIKKCHACNSLGNIMFSEENRDTCEYMVYSSHLTDDKIYSNCVGGYIITPVKVDINKAQGQNMYRLYAGNINQCISFKSYVDTKFVRFLVSLGLCASSVRNKETWRFVPAPEYFDHIFTDDELYKKYGLTAEEINIIESVIKERK